MDPATVQADLDAFREQTGIEVTYETPSLDADTTAMSARGASRCCRQIRTGSMEMLTGWGASDNST